MLSSQRGTRFVWDSHAIVGLSHAATRGVGDVSSLNYRSVLACSRLESCSSGLFTEILLKLVWNLLIRWTVRWMDRLNCMCGHGCIGLPNVSACHGNKFSCNWSFWCFVVSRLKVSSLFLVVSFTLRSVKSQQHVLLCGGNWMLWTALHLRLHLLDQL